MKTHFTKHALTLYYLYEKRGIESATLREIFDYQEEAKAWFDSKIPFEKLTAIKAKHGFTPESWADVLINSGSFYFIPTPEMNTLNREIKDFLKKYTFINTRDREINYCAAQLKNQVKRKNPMISRSKQGKLWVYQLTAQGYENIKVNQ